VTGLIAVVDTETTGLEADAQVIEAAWAFVSIDTAEVVSIESRLFRCENNAAAEVNGISSDVLKYGCLRDLIYPVHPVSAVLAHNAEFDRSTGCFSFRPDGYGAPTPWVCTIEDFPWPRPTRSRGLAELALAHGVGVVTAHRAYSDVLTLCLTLQRAHAIRPLSEMLLEALQPKPLYVSLASFERKEVVKAHGFRWVPEKKQWVRKMKPEDAAKLPFQTRLEDVGPKAVDVIHFAKPSLSNTIETKGADSE
jgi:DNA polymerase III subunit epsilon